MWLDVPAGPEPASQRVASEWVWSRRVGSRRARCPVAPARLLPEASSPKARALPERWSRAACPEVAWLRRDVRRQDVRQQGVRRRDVLRGGVRPAPVSQLPELVLPLPVSVSRTACRGVPLERRLARVSAAYAPHPVRPEWLQALASAACPAAAVLPRVAASASDVRAP
ncbi:MAG TPA: hypothetical protein DCS58_24535, partial [Bradyrhizobium sp.]|nr:hypothetical protein [Bradyrhizobium sp.]